MRHQSIAMKTKPPAGQPLGKTPTAFSNLLFVRGQANVHLSKPRNRHETIRPSGRLSVYVNRQRINMFARLSRNFGNSLNRITQTVIAQFFAQHHL